MKRQICSYDMVAVPSSSYTVTDAEGDMDLCNSRCLCIWAVMLVTKHLRDCFRIEVILDSFVSKYGDTPIQAELQAQRRADDILKG
jgi:hypothetical protein